MISARLSSSSFGSLFIIFLMWMNNHFQVNQKKCVHDGQELMRILVPRCVGIVDDNSGEIINRSTIQSAIELGSSNLQVDPIDDTTDVLDDFMSLADFNLPLFILHYRAWLILFLQVQNHRPGKKQYEMLNTTKIPNNGISILHSPRPPNNTISTQLDPRNDQLTPLRLTIVGSLPSLSISEIKGSSTYLFGNSTNSFFETNLGSRD